MEDRPNKGEKMDTDKFEYSDNGKEKQRQNIVSPAEQMGEVSKKITGRKNNMVDNQPKVSAGVMLEYRIKRLLFFMGYYPRLNIEIRTSPEEFSDVITDLDVYGIYVHKNFTTKTIWADCKSGNVKIHDRISWIKGVMNEIEVADVIFVAPKVRTTVKQYARKSGIQILDVNVISKLEQDFEIKENNWKGSWNPFTQNELSKIFSKISVPNNEIYKKVVKFISSDYWVLDNFSKAKKSITALKELSLICEFPLNEKEIKSVKWAIFTLVALLLLSILNISKEVYYFTDSEKKETIIEGLSSGEISNKKRAAIFDAAFKVAYGMVQKQIPEFKPPTKIPAFNLNPPSYTEAFYDLVLRITNSPFIYYDLLRFMDLILMEYDLEDKEIENNVLEEIFPNMQQQTFGAKTILHFICQVTNVPRSYFQLIK